MIVAETFGNQLSAFDIGPEGSLGRKRIFADLGLIPRAMTSYSSQNAWEARNGRLPYCLLALSRNVKWPPRSFHIILLWIGIECIRYKACRLMIRQLNSGGRVQARLDG